MHEDALSPALLDQIAQQTNLREGAEGVATFVRIALQNEPIRLNEIARRMRLPLPVTTALRRELERAGVLARGAGVELTAEGRAFAQNVLGFGSASAAFCPACDGSGLALVELALRQDLEAILGDAPPTRVELDQAPCTAETALRRAALMHFQGALEGRRVIMLGDDDSVSIACGIYLNAQRAAYSIPLQVTVLEIDPDRVAFLRNAAKRLDLDLTVIEHDLRNPLPANLCQSFDTFQTDPPYTIGGARLFVQRGVEALRGNGGRGFLSFGHKAPAEQRIILQNLIEAGFSISRIHPDFNTYQGASMLSGKSQLIELDAVALDRHQDVRWEDVPLYTAQQTKRKRSYQCANCGLKVNLGENGVPTTIEDLKSTGCSSCGGGVFQRKSVSYRE